MLDCCSFIIILLEDVKKSVLFCKHWKYQRTQKLTPIWQLTQPFNPINSTDHTHWIWCTNFNFVRERTRENGKKNRCKSFIQSYTYTNRQIGSYTWNVFKTISFLALRLKSIKPSTLWPVLYCILISIALFCVQHLIFFLVTLAFCSAHLNIHKIM